SFRRFGTGESYINGYVAGAGWRSFIDELAALLGERTVNSITAVRRASDKLSQLKVAEDLGFRVPETLVSNDASAVQQWGRERSRTITKLLGEAVIPAPDTEHGHSTFMTTRVDWELFNRHIEGAAAFPTLYQTEIPKAFELRVAVQGS